MLKAIKDRTSYRGEFKDVNVPKEDLVKIMEAGLAAPSGCNMQTTSLIAVDDAELLQKLHDVIGISSAKTAPAMICVLTQAVVAYKDKCFNVQDYSAAIQNMLLAIVELGYQSCWYEGQVTDTDAIGRQMADILNVPDGYELVCFLPVGVAAQPLSYAGKKPFKERAWFNGFKSGILALIIAIMMFAPSAALAAEQHDARLIVNGEEIASVVIIDGDAFVPWHEFGDANIFVDDNTGQLFIFTEFFDFVFDLESDSFMINGESFPLNTPAISIAGVPHIPLQALVRTSGFNMELDEDANAVHLNGIRVMFRHIAPHGTFELEVFDEFYPAFLVNGEALFPWSILEGRWEQESGQVFIVEDDLFEIVFTMDSDYFTLNDEVIPLDVPAQMFYGVPFVPFRPTLEALERAFPLEMEGLSIVWDEDTRTIYIVWEEDAPHGARLIVNGEEFTDIGVTILDGDAFIPWPDFDDAGQVLISTDFFDFVFILESDYFTINREQFPLDTLAIDIEGVPHIPLQALARPYGFDMELDEDANSIHLNGIRVMFRDITPHGVDEFEVFDNPTPAFLVNGRVFLPWSVFEGPYNRWEQESGQVFIVEDGLFEMAFTINSDYFTLNDELIPLDVPAQMFYGVPFVQFRPMLEALVAAFPPEMHDLAIIEWDADTRTIYLAVVWEHSDLPGHFDTSLHLDELNALMMYIFLRDTEMDMWRLQRPIMLAIEYGELMHNEYEFYLNIAYGMAAFDNHLRYAAQVMQGQLDEETVSAMQRSFEGALFFIELSAFELQFNMPNIYSSDSFLLYSWVRDIESLLMQAHATSADVENEVNSLINNAFRVAYSSLSDMPMSLDHDDFLRWSSIADFFNEADADARTYLLMNDILPYLRRIGNDLADYAFAIAWEHVSPPDYSGVGTLLPVHEPSAFMLYVILREVEMAIWESQRAVMLATHYGELSYDEIYFDTLLLQSLFGGWLSNQLENYSQFAMLVMQGQGGETYVSMQQSLQGALYLIEVLEDELLWSMPNIYNSDSFLLYSWVRDIESLLLQAHATSADVSSEIGSLINNAFRVASSSLSDLPMSVDNIEFLRWTSIFNFFMETDADARTSLLMDDILPYIRQVGLDLADYIFDAFENQMVDVEDVEFILPPSLNEWDGLADWTHARRTELDNFSDQASRLIAEGHIANRAEMI